MCEIINLSFTTFKIFHAFMMKIFDYQQNTTTAM